MGFLYYYSLRSGVDKETYKKIYEGLCSYAPKILVSSISANRIFELYRDVLNDHPELSVIDPLELNYEQVHSEIWLMPGYWFPENQILSNHMKFLDECTFIANRVTNQNATDIEKELAIHKFLVKNITYGKCHLNSVINDSLSQSAFSTLFERRGVCKGISMLFKCLADLVGLNVLVVEGELNSNGWEPHAWNMINIGGEYYHLDLTHDMVTFHNEGIFTFNGFNISDSEMELRYRWNRRKYPHCIGKKYGYYEYNNLLVQDNNDLQKEIRRQLNSKAKLLYFRVGRGSVLFLKEERKLADDVAEIISKELNRTVYIKYIFDMESGKCVCEVN